MAERVTSEHLLSELRERAAAELREDILPFWERWAFDSDGWLVGSVRDDLSIDDDVPRHSVIIARILWTFAAAAGAEQDPAQRERWLVVGRKALALLTGPCWDSANGGVFSSLDPAQRPLSDRKQVYAQGFAIYGLSEWYDATGDAAALAAARQLFDLIETHSRDHENGGYIEAHARDWGPLADMALSERDLNVPKSMNTNLHVLEAYTNLLRVTGDERVRAALADVLRVSLDHIVGYEPRAHCKLFFDLEWNSVVPTISYGHDIEASWLLWEAADAVGDEHLSSRARGAALELADAVLAYGVDADGSVLYEAVGDGVTEGLKHWWPQAEGVVGWLNAYQLTGRTPYRDAALKLWAYIEDHVVDHERGEWFAVLDRHGNPMPDHPASCKIGPWKCPYHDGRVCLEVMRRIGS
jgi:mannobiose 2-epimerase